MGETGPQPDRFCYIAYDILPKKRQEMARHWRRSALGCALLNLRKGSVMAHRVYEAIVTAVRTGRLIEPFSKDRFRSNCLGFGKGTYNAFLDKHSVGNPGNNSELFERVAPGKFRCVRPFKYDV